jgi:hypothetical protein
MFLMFFNGFDVKYIYRKFAIIKESKLSPRHILIKHASSKFLAKILTSKQERASSSS